MQQSVDIRREASAGAVAAAAWLAVEPLACRVFATPFSTPRLLGAPVAPGRAGTAAGVALHLVNGALAGVAFSRLGIRDWKRGLIASQAENVLLWPALAVVDRYHPERRAGRWPPLLRSGRAFAKEAAVHAVFGAVLGLLLDREREERAGPT